MNMPTHYERERALHEAARLRESGQDHHFLGKTLLNASYRLERLEHLLTLTEAYLHCGQDELRHAQLVNAIQAYRRLRERTEAVVPVGFGLE